MTLADHPWDGFTERRQTRGAVERLATLEAHMDALKQSLDGLREEIKAAKPSLMQVLSIGIMFSGFVLALVGGIGYLGVVLPREAIDARVAALEMENRVQAKVIAKLEERFPALTVGPTIGATPRGR